jgi:predicted nucleotidyltransferase
MDAHTIAKNGLIYLVVAGSRMTGVNPDGDIDQIGVCLEPAEYVIGHKTFEQYIYRSAAAGERSEPGGLDLTVYSARKFTALAGKGNPTLLEILFAPKESVVQEDLYRSKLLKPEKYVSRQAGHRYLGYMHSQMGALRGEKKHTNRPELIQQYGYDCKFAAHALRLGLQGIELMETGRISLPMVGDALEIVRSARRGEWTAESVLLEAEALEKRLEKAVEKTKLPDRADWEWIDNTLVDLHVEYWKGQY